MAAKGPHFLCSQKRSRSIITIVIIFIIYIINLIIGFYIICLTLENRIFLRYYEKCRPNILCENQVEME